MPPPASRIQRVNSFHELSTLPFAGGINALCWPRMLPGDFAEVVALLGKLPRDPTDEPDEGLITIQPSALLALRSLGEVGSAARTALEILLEDLQRLRDQNRDPVLNLIHGYPHDADGPVPTDVYSFHADSAPIPADTWLCTYHGPPSEGLRNEDAQRRIDVPETRAALLKIFGGKDDESFAEFLRENHYDLHYAPTPNTSPYSFGIGNLWRIACDYPASPVPPCIHRAPVTLPGAAPRLLLIS